MLASCVWCLLLFGNCCWLGFYDFAGLCSLVWFWGCCLVVRATLFLGFTLWLICFNSVAIGVGFGFVVLWFVVCYLLLLCACLSVGVCCYAVGLSAEVGGDW